MLSKNKIKYIRSLELKKNRKEEKVFVAEGHKLVDGAFSLSAAGGYCRMVFFSP